jgi:flavin reductase (DIM6/NTAB) family NADH-FMN oxidoreductase RutF
MMKREITVCPPLVPLFPVPIVLVTCGTAEKPNVFTVGWTGVVCSEPPQIGIAVRPSRYSHRLIVRQKEFVVNIPTVELVQQVDLCGTVSGRKTDKFSLAGLTAEPSLKVAAPCVAECVLNVECKLRRTLKLGSHSFFIGEVAAVQANEEIIVTDSRPHVDFGAIRLLCMNLFEYWTLGTKVGDAYMLGDRSNGV